jgi:hypothetical protein
MLPAASSIRQSLRVEVKVRWVGEGTVPPVAWLALARSLVLMVAGSGPLDRRGRRFKLVDTSSHQLQSFEIRQLSFYLATRIPREQGP